MTQRESESAGYGSDALRRKALERLRRGSTRIADMDSKDLRSLVHELEVHQAELEVQNEELRRTEGELAEAEERYRTLYEFAPVGYLSLDSRCIVREANSTLCDLCGIDRTEIIGRRFESLLLSDDRDTAYKQLRSAAARGKHRHAELRLLRENRAPLWAGIEILPLTDDRNELTGYRVTVADINERKKAEAARDQYYDRLQLALKAGETGLWSVSLQTDEAFFSDSLCDMLGHAREAPVGVEVFLQYVHEEDRARVERHTREWMKTGGDFHDEFRIVRTDGEVRWLASVGYLYYDSQQRPVRIAGANYDITQRKIIEVALQESEGRLRSLVENLPFEFWAMDAHGVYIEQNAAAEAAVGDRTGLRPEHVAPTPEVLAHWRENNRRAFAGETVAGEVTYERDGEQRVFHNIVAPIEVDHAVHGILGVNIDITDRKRAEQALADRMEELRCANEELERFNRAAVGREQRMIDLKREINTLLQELGRPEKYRIDFPGDTPSP